MKTKFKAGDWVYCRDFSGATGKFFKPDTPYQVIGVNKREDDTFLIFDHVRGAFPKRFALAAEPPMLDGATEYEETIAFEELVNGGTQ